MDFDTRTWIKKCETNREDFPYDNGRWAVFLWMYRSHPVPTRWVHAYANAYAWSFPRLGAYAGAPGGVLCYMVTYLVNDEHLPTRLCLRLRNKNQHCFSACLCEPMRTAKYQVNSVRSFIRSSFAARNLSFRVSPSDELSKASGFQLPRLVLMQTSLHSHCLQTNSGDKKDAKSGWTCPKSCVFGGGLSMITFQPERTGQRKTLQNIVRSAMSDHSIKICQTCLPHHLKRSRSPTDKGAWILLGRSTTLNAWHLEETK